MVEKAVFDNKIKCSYKEKQENILLRFSCIIDIESKL